MRADRLISIVMLLQAHARMTAGELSEELEVTPRTIYRDITALNAAGIPVYTDRGPGGGISLLESYRTSLTGMSAEEAQALFMISIPQALVDLGVGMNLRRALLKLAAAMPPSQQYTPARIQQRIYLDSTPWQAAKEKTPLLAVLHGAVMNDERIRLVFQGSFDTKIELELEPLGLVAKMNTWYLVGKAGDHLRVLKVGDILSVDPLGESFTRDHSFNLAAFWEHWCADSLSLRPHFNVRLRMKPGLIAKLKFYLDETVEVAVSGRAPTKEGWQEVSITYDNFFQARESILSFGSAAEVLEPYALRISVIDFAEQIIDFYRSINP